MRPAPIIVNWLGYPGSTGSTFHNYIIADDYIIPKGSEIYYSENVLRLPCYQPNDRKRVISNTPPTRSQAGLPEDAVVFCSFNGLQKLTKFTFSRWISILREVPNGVLWTLGSSDETNTRLKKLAEEQGVAGDRIIIAPKMANPDHVARYVLADLFLDMTPYGAHTTASDALWMGVPVLTVPGRSFPSRVCASLLHAAGLEELICETPQAYVETAVALGKDREKLQSYRRFLLNNRSKSVLFDTGLTVRSLEALYEEMWSDYARGELPQPDLTNIEIYYEIGCAIEHEKSELLTLPDYEAYYRRRLAHHYAFSPFGPDQRLWPMECFKAMSGDNAQKFVAGDATSLSPNIEEAA
jgi:predicted O-linked N-acetylglucosamine transferase (SPINDLY family)